MVGAFLASVPVDHQHVLLQAVPGHEVARDTPCFRDPDNLVYGRPEAGGMLVGGYEPEPPARWTDGVPWEHGAARSSRTSTASRRCWRAPSAVSPSWRTPGSSGCLSPGRDDARRQPAAGPDAGRAGVLGGGGVLPERLRRRGRAGEEPGRVDDHRRHRAGRRGVPGVAVRPAVPRHGLRRGDGARGLQVLLPAAVPAGHADGGAGKRLSPLHVRLEDLGAVFGTKGGWERADCFEPGRRWRRAGEDQRAFGWSTPPYLDRLASEHAAFRERAGIVDLTSFGKLAVSGPGALPCSSACATTASTARPAARSTRSG